MNHHAEPNSTPAFRGSESPQHPNTKPGARAIELPKARKSRCADYFNTRFGPGRSDPWLNRKAAVGVLLALSIWSFYVIAGIMCIPAIQRRSSTNLSVADGAGVLVGYIILFILYAWSYWRMLTTGPGFAKKLVPQCDPPTTSYAPMHPALLNPPPQSNTQSDGRPGQQLGVFPISHSGAYQPGQRDKAQGPPVHDSSTAIRATIDSEAPDPRELSPAVNFLHTAVHSAASRDQESSSVTLSSQHLATASTQVGSKRVAPEWRQVERPMPDIHYGPRWCRFCRIIKPDRTHHCRHCGTCIMQFDHHCMWVGQCVGWGNHKFFMTFCFWAMWYLFYILILCIIFLTRASEIDGQVIGLIAVSALFGLFTGMMLIQHLYLIVTGKTTLEAFESRDQSERESKHLSIEFGFWMHQAEKRKVRRKWKEEWGGSGADERWLAGTRMEMWKREMGPMWYHWILPLGRPQGDGIQFPSNPRFGTNGEWLRKKDWPAGVK